MIEFKTSGLLTLREAAEYLKVNPQTLRRAVRDHKIDHKRVGNAPDPKKRPIRFTVAALDQYANRLASN